MEKFFIAALIIQFLVEVLVGITMVVAPGSMVPDAAVTETWQLRNQGFVAISIGLATLMLWFQRGSPEVIAFASGFFVIYHFLVSASGAINSTMGFDFAPMMLHVVLGLVFLVVWMKRKTISGQLSP